jgi:hypothetical protein
MDQSDQEAAAVVSNQEAAAESAVVARLQNEADDEMVSL